MAPYFCQFYIHFIKRGAIGPFWWPLPSQIQSIPWNLRTNLRRLKWSKDNLNGAIDRYFGDTFQITLLIMFTKDKDAEARLEFNITDIV